MAKISVIGICGKSVFMSVEHFHQNGETLIADEIFEEIGGKGINQAVAAARMGAKVSFLAAIGDDRNGQECIQTAIENNINIHLITKKGKATPIAYILTDKTGENRVTEYQGAKLTSEDVLLFEEEIKTSDILLLQQETLPEVNKTAIALAKKYNVRVILNPAPIREHDSSEYGVFMVTPNKQESEGIDCDKYENSVVTLGGEGCLINGKIKLPAMNVKPVNTTGAGDTFNGVLAVCISEGMPLELACQYAVTASGISVGRKYVLNAIPTKAEIEKEIKR